MKTFVENEATFEEYKALANDIFHRLGAFTSCDPDFADDSLYSELGVCTLIWNHFCDRYVAGRGTPYECISMDYLVDYYDRDPEYAIAYLKQFESILDKYHVENCDNEPNSINLDYIR